MRVLMISDVYFPRVNGVSTSIQTFRKELAALGCDSVLIAPRYPEDRDEEPAVTRVRSRYVPFDPEDRMMVGRELATACARARGPFDVVHVQTPFVAHRVGTRMARKLGVKVVETYHTLFEEYAQHYLPFLPRAPLRWAARRVTRRQCSAVDAVVAPTEPMAALLRAYGVRSPIEVIPTGLDVREFALGDRARFRLRFAIGAERPVMLYVGRVAFEKNIVFLLDVLSAVRQAAPDVLLVIAGDGPARGALSQDVFRRGLQDNVLFLGYLDRMQALADCYHGADVFVFASRTETQGLVLLEALASGLPLVSTSVMGTQAILDHAQGALVAPERAADFAAAVLQLLERPDLRAKLSGQGRAYAAEHWDSRKMARRLLDLYGRVSGIATSAWPGRFETPWSCR